MRKPKRCFVMRCGVVLTQINWAGTEDDLVYDAREVAEKWASRSEGMHLSIADKTNIIPKGRVARYLQRVLRERGIRAKVADAGVDIGVGTAAGRSREGKTFFKKGEGLQRKSQPHRVYGQSHK